MTRKEIKEIPKNSEELYLRFEVYDWKKLNRSLKVEGYQVRKVLYTTEYLLNNSEVVTELLIKSKEEFRIWKELKRMHREIKTILNSKSIGNETRLSGFSINNMDVYIDEDTIKIINKGKICGKYTLKEFRKYPTVVVKNIRDNCKK